MTAAEAGAKTGAVLEVCGESGLDTDEPALAFKARTGLVNSDFSIGGDVTSAAPLRSNSAIASNGVLLAGRGFVINQTAADHLGLRHRAGMSKHIRPYINGRDLYYGWSGKLILDFFGVGSDEIRTRYPEAYQHLMETVKKERDKVAANTSVRDAHQYAASWWQFAKDRRAFREAMSGLSRFIGTTETAKHRIFQFIDCSFLNDHMVIGIAIQDACYLAIMSSRLHMVWAVAAGGWLGVGNDPRYSKSRCFDPFPFPDPPEALRQKLRDAGEELDALRKRVLAEHSDLTLTGLYNVLEKVRGAAPSTASRSPSPAGGGGSTLTAKDEDVKDRGLVLILKELHETIDRLTAQAYGWPVDLSDEQILERLVALNAERAREEAAGHVRWLRPDYQIPRFAKGAAAKTGELDLGVTVVPIDKGLPPWPKDRYEQPLAVEMVLAASAAPMDAAALSRAFKGGGRKIESRVAQVLATLARYGRVTALPDGRFAARKAA